VTQRVGVNAYWPRVWGARGLLHLYRPQAEPAVVAGLSDEHWRVREMCAKVARAHEVGAAAAALSARCADQVPRVRAAAVRALAVVGEAEDADAVRDCLDDPERSVAAAAERALTALSKRLDRDLSVEG
jgi:HEAT repeat protein